MAKGAKKSSFGVKKEGDSPGFLLWQTTSTWQRLIKKSLEPYGISHTHHVILAILLWFEEHDEEVTQMTLSQWSKMDKMTISLSLKGLVAEGYVKRQEHKTDTRAKVVSLTTKGKALAQKLVPIVEKTDALFFDKLSGKDQEALITLLSKLMGTV